MTDVTLREISDDLNEARQVVAWRNAAARWFPAQDRFTINGHLDWYRDVYKCDPSQNLYLVCADHKAIGMVGMTIRKGSGELERMVLGNQNYARGGYMRQGMRQLMGAYGLNHYWLRVMPDNEVTISFHKRNGFLVSGTGGWYQNIYGHHGKYVIMSRNYDGYWPEVPVK